MDELQQIRFVPDGTAEQAQAVSLHYEIMSAAQTAAESLLTLGRKLKQMRDTRGYERLGFESFAQYTERAVGIRQRQAYNYISVVEKVPAQLVEENAAAGVTKLALLGRLGPADQREVAANGTLADITVTELKALIDEKNDMAQQLSLLQKEHRPEPVEGDAREVDLDTLRAELLEQARGEVAATHRKELAEQERRLKQEYADRLESRVHEVARDQYDDLNKRTAEIREQADREKKEYISRLQEETKEKLRKAKEDADRAARKKISDARREGADEARLQMQKDNAAVMEEARRVVAEAEKAADAARKEAEAANARAAEVARELQLAASPESTRFALLFDDLQEKAQAMLDLADRMEQDGRAPEAKRYRSALRQALAALIEQTGAEQIGLEE